MRHQMQHFLELHSGWQFQHQQEPKKVHHLFHHLPSKSQVSAAYDVHHQSHHLNFNVLMEQASCFTPLISCSQDGWTTKIQKFTVELYL